jgi:hypothetical protein
LIPIRRRLLPFHLNVTKFQIPSHCYDGVFEYGFAETRPESCFESLLMSAPGYCDQSKRSELRGIIVDLLKKRGVLRFGALKLALTFALVS